MIVTCWNSTNKEEYVINVAIGGAFCGHKILRAEFTAKDFAEIRNLNTSDSQDARLSYWLRHMAMRNDVAEISRANS